MNSRPDQLIHWQAHPATDLNRRFVTRFAPSPTGHLHLGHVASALYVWGLGEALGADIILRMEDHDQGRCRPQFEASILEDLQWLGFHAHRGVASGEKPLMFRQSDHFERYEQAARQLARHHNVYYCACSRKDLQDRHPEHPHDGTELPYDGFCRNRQLPPEGHAMRVVIPPDIITFWDHHLGEQTQVPERQCGDLMLRDRDGHWTYQFAVVVDDGHEGINLVIRGQDLTDSTGRQILLARMLGRTDAPIFYHHPLLRDPTGRKLGKRDFAEAIGNQRQQGIIPAVVVGQAAYLSGLQTDNRPLQPGQWKELFGHG